MAASLITFTEETMSTQTIRQFETRREVALTEIEDGQDFRCEDLVLVERKHQAEMQMVASEGRLSDFEDGSFTQRWDCWKAAEVRWWNAIEAIRKHRSMSPIVPANS
jgi:hypothetical protein